MSTDESLDTLSVMASNVVEEEMGEHSDLALAAEDTEEVVRAPDHIVKVLDAAGRPLNPESPAFPLDATAQAQLMKAGIKTISSADGGLWRFAIRTGRSHGQDYSIVVGAPLKDVREHWRALVEASAIGLPLVLAVGVAGGWWLGRHGLRPLRAMASQARDITANTSDRRLDVPPTHDELSQLGDSFNRVLGRLGSALVDQRRFMADASHELRTPVSIIRTAAQVTLSQPIRDAAEYREALEAVAQQSSRLTRLVDDMLVMARADAGGYPMAIADVDLGELARDSVRDLTFQASDRCITIKTEIPSVAFVAGDESLLRRVIVNLLSNGIAYTAEGGRVTVTLASTRDAVELRVSDSGVGIAPEDQARIFERFVRLDPARGGGGAGLGLAIARWIVEAHRGSLVLERSNSHGSVFLARFPATAGAVDREDVRHRSA